MMCWLDKPQLKQAKLKLKITDIVSHKNVLIHSKKVKIFWQSFLIESFPLDEGPFKNHFIVFSSFVFYLQLNLKSIKPVAEIIKQS